LAPFLVGVARDRLGSYDEALLVASCLLLISGTVTFALGPYAYPAKTDTK
jgi:cyanate permease